VCPLMGARTNNIRAESWRFPRRPRMPDDGPGVFQAALFARRVAWAFSIAALSAWTVAVRDSQLVLT